MRHDKTHRVVKSDAMMKAGRDCVRYIQQSYSRVTGNRNRRSGTKIPASEVFKKIQMCARN